MSDTFTVKLNRLAELIAHSSGAQPGGYVVLSFHHDCAELAQLVMERCYKMGVAHVIPQYLSQRALAAKLQHAPESQRCAFSDAERQMWPEVYKRQGTFISIRTDYDPALFADLSEELADWQLALKETWGEGFTKGVLGGQRSWTLFFQPNETLATQVFPDVTEEEAMRSYWDQLFAITGADRPDCMEFVKTKNEKLLRRRNALNMMGIRELHFTSSSGTDFTIGLSEKARWAGGESTTPAGVAYTANVPTYEVFTTPDWRTAKGLLKVTRPNLIDAEMLDDIRLTFNEGEITTVAAGSGDVSVLQRLFDTDDGAKRAGEIALVGTDSPVFQSGHVFRTVIVDENASSHIAVGAGLGKCIKGFGAMSDAEKEAIGFNTSLIHRDFMISDETTTVTATTYDDQTHVIMKDGMWTGQLQ